MKCQYCGSNLGIEDAVCPYCGKVNEQAAGHQAVIKEYRDEYEKTKADVKVKSKTAGRTGRLIVIGVMIFIIILMRISIGINSDVGAREKNKEKKIAKEVALYGDDIDATLKELEKKRDYLGLNYYSLNYRLRSEDKYNEYTRVFTAVIDYSAIYEDILCILDGFDGYEEKTDKDYCNNIAIYVSDWNNYVGGAFWNDSATSPMHSGEHGAFLSDIRKDTQDMIQVYFDLTDDQAKAMWNMDRDSLGEMLYEKCRVLYPEEGADE